MKRISGVIVKIIFCFVLSNVSFAQETFVYDSHNKRDPFWPLVNADGTSVTYDTDFVVSDLLVEGIVASGNGNVAIINGRVVSQGELLGPYTIESIEVDKVIFLKDSERFELPLSKDAESE